jgi:hypothetical protein
MGTYSPHIHCAAVASGTGHSALALHFSIYIQSTSLLGAKLIFLHDHKMNYVTKLVENTAVNLKMNLNYSEMVKVNLKQNRFKLSC